MKIWLCIERNPHLKLHFQEHEIQSSVPVQHMLSLLMPERAIRKYYIFALSFTTSINLPWCIMFIFAPKCIKYCLSCLRKLIALCVHVRACLCVFSFQAPSVSFYLSFRWACVSFICRHGNVCSQPLPHPTNINCLHKSRTSIRLYRRQNCANGADEWSCRNIVQARWSFDHEWHFRQALDWTDSTVY